MLWFYHSATNRSIYATQSTILYHNCYFTYINIYFWSILELFFKTLKKYYQESPAKNLIELIKIQHNFKIMYNWIITLLPLE